MGGYVNAAGVIVWDTLTVVTAGWTVPPDRLVLNAPRPLYGTDVPSPLPGFTVDASDLDQIMWEENRRLDAVRVFTVHPADARAAEERRLRMEYGDDVVDNAGFTVGDLLDSYVVNNAPARRVEP